MYILYLLLLSYQIIAFSSWHSAKWVVIMEIFYLEAYHLRFYNWNYINLFKEVPTYKPKSAVQNMYIFVKLDIYCKDRYNSHSAEQNIVPKDPLKTQHVLILKVQVSSSPLKFTADILNISQSSLKPGFTANQPFILK